MAKKKVTKETVKDNPTKEAVYSAPYQVDRIDLINAAGNAPDARAYLNEVRDWCGELIEEITLRG